MANQPPKSFSSPSTLPKTTLETSIEDPGKSAPPTEIETLVSVPNQRVLEKTSPQPMSRRKRTGSRINRDDRRHQARRYRVGGSTYRPNYDALPERRREYREYPERRREIEPPRQEPYHEYSTITDTYDKRINPRYPHEDYTWGRPLYEFK